ncbi:MAG: hypothetical protein AABZ30_00630 [Myxococcota bacterium]
MTKRVFVVCVALGACGDKPPEKLVFPPMRPPSGAPAFETVRDEAVDTPGRVGIEAVLVVPQRTEYEGLERLLPSLARQARARSGFRNAPRPGFVDVRVYDDRAKAADADGWLGRVRVDGADEPQVDIRIPFPLGKRVAALLDKNPEFVGIRPKVDAVDAEGKLLLTLPFVEPGEDAYLAKIDYGRAVQIFNTWARDLFAKFPALRELAFVGEHQGTSLLQVRLTREQYDALGITKIEEDLGAFVGQFMGGMLQGAIEDAVVQAKLAKKRRQVYGAMLAKLPAEQVVVSKKLR